MKTLGNVAFGVVSFFLQFQLQFEGAQASPIPIGNDAPPPPSVKINVPAVGDFSKGIGSCVAFWFDSNGTETSTPYVLTNAHCILESTDPQTVINKSSEYTRFWVHGNIKFEISRIAYATVEGSDLAILPLNATSYRDLENLGMMPLKISEQGAAPGMSVIRAQKPEVGYPCLIDAVVPWLKEGRWLWQDSYRYQCYRRHGASGSPVISTQSGEVVAIHNTGGAERGDCSEDNPCEVDRNRNTYYKKEFGYAQHVDMVPGCFNKKGNFDLKLPSCRLRSF